MNDKPIKVLKRIGLLLIECAYSGTRIKILWHVACHEIEWDLNRVN